MSNPLLTLIEQADKEFSEKFDVELVEWCGYGRKEDWRNCQQCVIRQQGIDERTLDELSSHIHQLLLSIAKGEVARLEAEVRPNAYLEDGTLQERDNYFFNLAISHSLEHWKQVIIYLEKK